MSRSSPHRRSLGGGQVCLRNDGRRTLQLVGSSEASTVNARPGSTVDDKPIEPKVALSIVLGLLTALLVVALPLGMVGALVWTLRRS